MIGCGSSNLPEEPLSFMAVSKGRGTTEWKLESLGSLLWLVTPASWMVTVAVTTLVDEVTFRFGASSFQVVVDTVVFWIVELGQRRRTCGVRCKARLGTADYMYLKILVRDTVEVELIVHVKVFSQG